MDHTKTDHKTQPVVMPVPAPVSAADQRRQERESEREAKREIRIDAERERERIKTAHYAEDLSNRSKRSDIYYRQQRDRQERDKGRKAASESAASRQAGKIPSRDPDGSIKASEPEHYTRVYPDDGLDDYLAAVESEYGPDWADRERRRLRGESTPAERLDVLLPAACDTTFDEFIISDVHLANRIMNTHIQDNLLYVRKRDVFMLWIDGRGWTVCPMTDLIASIKEYGTWNYYNAEGDHSYRFGGATNTARGVIAVMKKRQGTNSEDWDSQPAVIGLPGCRKLDLRTGAISTRVKADLISKQLSAAPCQSEAEFYRSKIASVILHLLPDDGLREWIQRRLGAALMNAPGMHNLVWIYGAAGAGKSCLLKGLSAAFGDLAYALPPEEFGSGFGGHRAWKAAIQGHRLLIIEEPPDEHLSAAKLKSVLGSRIAANHMRGATFTFTNHAPILVSSNALPAFRVRTAGIGRRLVPVEIQPPTWNIDAPDPSIESAITNNESEHAALLWWCAQGANAFAVGGLPALPETVKEDRQTTFDESIYSDWIETVNPNETYTLADLYKSYSSFSLSLNETPASHMEWRNAMKNEFRQVRVGTTRKWRLTEQENV